MEPSNLSLRRREPLTSPIGSPIPICVSNGEAYIWAVDQVERLRVDHQICGLLTGTLPQLAQQNVFLGLPLQLMPEEVVTLVDLGIAVLVDEKGSHRSATVEEADQYKSRREKEIEEEVRSLTIRDAERRAAMKDLYRSQIEAAEQIRQARRQQAQVASETDSVPEEQGLLVSEEPDETKAPPSTAAVSHYVPTHLRSQPPTYQPEAPHLFSDLATARQAGIWTYPHDKYQRARCAVFSALWRTGMFLGIGFKFGCDFLVYPGDTLRFHSHFACTVISDPQAPIAPLALVSFGRLATAVKKAHLLACWDEESGEVKYLSLEWAGMG